MGHNAGGNRSVEAQPSPIHKPSEYRNRYRAARVSGTAVRRLQVRQRPVCPSISSRKMSA